MFDKALMTRWAETMNLNQLSVTIKIGDSKKENNIQKDRERQRVDILIIDVFTQSEYRLDNVVDFNSVRF